jgi:hypothetical protein
MEDRRKTGERRVLSQNEHVGVTGQFCHEVNKLNRQDSADSAEFPIPRLSGLVSFSRPGVDNPSRECYFFFFFFFFFILHFYTATC